MGTIDIVIAAAICFCGLLALLMAVSQLVTRGRTFSNSILFALLSGIGLYLFQFSAYLLKAVSVYPALALLHLAIILTIGPSLYFAYRSLILSGPVPASRMAVHYLPAAAALAAETLFAATGDRMAMQQIADSFFTARSQAIAVIRFLLAAAALHLFAYQSIILKDVISLLRGGTRDVISRISLGVISASMLVMPIIITGLLVNELPLVRAGVFLAGMIIVFVYLAGSRYPEFMQSLRKEIRENRYRKSLLTGLDVEAIGGRLRELMEEDRIYSDDSLTLAGVAGMLFITPHQLSQYLNERQDMNFNTYINNYRVREAMTLLTPDSDLSILQIAYSVGFNSKSSFNIAFKKYTGTTPQAYRSAGAVKPSRSR